LPQTVTDLQDFRSPSGNLDCRLDDQAVDEVRSVVGCHAYEHDFAAPQTPADCEGDLVPAVWLGMDDVVMYGWCSGDPFAVAQETLPYGSATAVGDFACLSEASGVTCWNVKSKHGFVISRESYRVF
jgi:hypothetical protein